MIFRVKYQSPSGAPHVYCDLYSVPGPHQTSALLGSFTVRAGEEFEALKEACSGVQFVEVERSE